MKKIFSILCAVAVAISLPLLAFTVPTKANAQTIYNPYVTVNGIYSYDTRLDNNENTATYMYVDFSTFDDSRYVRYCANEYSINGAFVYQFLNGIPFLPSALVNADLYSSSGLVESNVTFNAYLIASISNDLDDYSVIVYAVPTVVSLSQPDLYYSYLPISTANMFDLYVVTKSNTGAFRAYYYYWAMTLVNGRLFSTSFNTSDTIVSYVPSLVYNIADVSTLSTYRNYLGVAQIAHDSLLNPIGGSIDFCLGFFADFPASVWLNVYVPDSSAWEDTYDVNLGKPFSINSIFDIYTESTLTRLTVFENYISLSLPDISNSYQDGYNAGYDYGRSIGDSQGFNRGYNEGYNNGKVDGLELSGIANIRAQEYNRGFLDGLARAESDGGSFGFISLLTTIADTQLALLTSFLDFNFLGWNMLTFFKSLLTICIVIMIIKFII